MRVIQATGVVVVAVFCVIVFTPIANEASRYFSVGSTVQPGGAIVVPSAGIWKGSMLDDESLRRTVRGIELFKSNVAPIPRTCMNCLAVSRCDVRFAPVATLSLNTFPSI